MRRHKEEQNFAFINRHIVMLREIQIYLSTKFHFLKMTRNLEYVFR